uniref:Uncharacterized protein n=1 Tax=Tetranychus urticae TaxID=32264 RepID=T1JX53_TETUR
MFNLGSFKLFSPDSISKDLSSSDYAKTEKRLKELSSFLGLNNKQSWSSQLTSRVIPSTLNSVPASTTSGLNHQHILNSHQSSHFHPVFTSNDSVERIVSIHWNDVYKSLVVVLSNGLIASCFFHPSYLNCINYIYLDKYLIGKIKTEYMVDFIFDNRMIIISYTNPRITCILLDDGKRNKSWTSRKRKLFKLKSQNVKIIEHELDINCGRRAERHLLKSEIKNDDEDLLLVWWQNGSNTICPWSSPITSNKDFCNILIYNIIHNSFDLVGYASILNDILKICFCKRRINRLMTVESDGDHGSILFREYQINFIDECYVIEMVESIQLAVPCQVVKADINFNLNKVILLCEDRSVLVYSIDQNSIRYFQAPINAIDLVNSPSDSYFIMSDSFGQIMMYDYGLHVMPANYDDLFLREAFTGLSELKFLNNSLVCLRFMDDPNLMLIVLPNNLDYIGLIRSYVKHDYINEAIENVQLLNWNLNSYLAYSSLNIIFNHLLKTPLNTIKESQLQEALATFFIPKIPIAEDIIEEYQYEMHCIAKRFFYHLYRYSCLEKAFMLALDLKSRHLFLLLHKIAKERGNEKLAEVSLTNAHKFNHSSNTNNCAKNEPTKELPNSNHPRTLTTFKPVRKDQSSTHEPIPMYSSPRKRGELATNKVSKAGIVNPKIENPLNYQLSDTECNSFQAIHSQPDHGSSSYQSDQSSTETYKLFVPPPLPPVCKDKPQILMTPPPLPPKIKNRDKVKSQFENQLEANNFIYEAKAYSDLSETRDSNHIGKMMSRDIQDNPSSTPTEYQINQTIKANNESMNSMIPESEKQNVPLQINHLMKSHVNNDNPKIECIHYGLV